MVHRGGRLRAIAATGRRAIRPALFWTGGRFALGAVSGALQGEEARPTPGRAGNGACNRREARIGHSLPQEAIALDRDGVALALILAKEHRAGFEVATAGTALSREAVQERQGLAIETAERPLLDAPGDHPSQQVLAQTRRRRAAEHRPPVPPKSIERERADAIDLGRDRGRVCPALPHGYARG